MLIDTHCHLNHKRLLHIGDTQKIIDNAKKAGVERFLTINCRISDEFEEILALARQFDEIWCSIATHPHDAGDEAEKAITREQLVTLAGSDPKIIGIGETGLDYYYKHASVEDQQASFRKHIQACLETGLPLIIHSRDADEDIMKILKEEAAGTGLKGVFHCFSSSPELAVQALDFGFYLSFSGIVTFKKSDDLRDIAKNTPLDRLLVETDAPFLAPEPHRGAICEPAHVFHTACVLADLHNVTKKELMTHSTNNFFELFDRAERI